MQPAALEEGEGPSVHLVPYGIAGGPPGKDVDAASEQDTTAAGETAAVRATAAERCFLRIRVAGSETKQTLHCRDRDGTRDSGQHCSH